MVNNVKVQPRIHLKVHFMKKFIAFIACFMALAVIESYAQRTMERQYFISAGVSHEFVSPAAFGGSLSWGQYLHKSYWKVSAEVQNRSIGLSTGHDFEYTHFFVAGDWMFRCVSTVSRSLSFYVGAGVFTGYEAYDMMHKIPGNISVNLDKGAFLYGVRPSVELEYFVAEKAALLLNGSLPMHFGSPTGWFKWSAGVGFRYNF